MLHEEIFFKNKTIRRKNCDDRCRITLFKMHESEKNAGSRVFILRLNDDAAWGTRSHLPAHLVKLQGPPGDDDKELLRRDQLLGAMQGLLQQKQSGIGQAAWSRTIARR